MKLAYLIWLIASFMSETPRNELAKNVETQAAYAKAAQAAGEKYLIDPDMLIVWAYAESSLNPNAIGKKKEVGLFQIHGRANRDTCIAAGHDLQTIEGQFMCGALIINMGWRACGSLQKGLYTYSCKSCNGCPRGIKAVRYRLWLLKKKRSEYESLR